MKSVIAYLFAAASLAGCTVAPATAPATTPQTIANACHPSSALVNSALWQQTAVEYRANAQQAYNGARRMLDAGLADPTWTAALEQTTVTAAMPPAVILDLDETVFNGSAFQARQVLERTTYTDETFAAFLAEGIDPALDGAKEFLDYAASRGVRIFYVTNRNMQMREATIHGLRRAQLPLDADASNLLSKDERPGWGSDKTSRRAYVAQTHRVILLIGDDFNDFVFATGKSLAERTALFEQHGHLFGNKWFIIANPSYGSWERSVIGQNGLTTEQEYEIKLRTLDSGRGRPSRH